MILFVIFGGIALGAGIGMILQRHPVHAALLLVVNLISVSVLFLTLGAEFLFVSQIIVYAGAIVVLFLFVIMLLGVGGSEDLMEPRAMQRRQFGIGAAVCLALVGAITAAISSKSLSAPVAAAPQGFGSAEFIGGLLFQRYLLPFEVTGLLLLVATIGILMLAKRKMP